MDCLFAVVLLLVYPVLQGYALFRLRDGLRPFAWSILILVVLFSCLMFGSIFFDTGNTVTFYNGVVQVAVIFMAWMLASLILLLLLLSQVATSSKIDPTATKIANDP